MDRRGKEYYAVHYEAAMKLYREGMPLAEIAKKLGVSYSAVYHWAKGIRTPEQGNTSAFVDHLRKGGPSAVVDIKEHFPKHNELFLIASRRGLPVKRFMMKKKYKDYSTWYYLEGQEKQLDANIEALMSKIKEINEKLASMGQDKS